MLFKVFFGMDFCFQESKDNYICLTFCLSKTKEKDTSRSTKKNYVTIYVARRYLYKIIFLNLLPELNKNGINGTLVFRNGFA